MKCHQLLATPDKWTQGCLARNDQGKSVSEADIRASCFCLLGAVFKCYDEGEYDAVGAKLSSEIQDFVSWNDDPDRTHAEVLTLLTKLDI